MGFMQVPKHHLMRGGAQPSRHKITKKKQPMQVCARTAVTFLDFSSSSSGKNCVSSPFIASTSASSGCYKAVVGAGLRAES